MLIQVTGDWLDKDVESLGKAFDTEYKMARLAVLRFVKDRKCEP